MRAAVTGILWINNKDKLVVAGFTPGSQAKQAGVVCGDILRKVDGMDVLKMKSEVCVWPLLHRTTRWSLGLARRCRMPAAPDTASR